MNKFYNYNYCCKKLEMVGRGIRDEIGKDLPVMFTDVRMMMLFSWLLPKDEQECPFCNTFIEDVLYEMREQWYDKHPEAKSSIEA